MTRVVVKIFPDGRVQATVRGIKGPKCTDYIKIIEELAEAETVDSEYTPEYFEENILTETPRTYGLSQQEKHQEIQD